MSSDRLAALMRRPLEERQRECEEKMRAAMDEPTYNKLVSGVKWDRLKWSLMPAILGRDLFELFWSVYRDTVEAEAEKALAEYERIKASPRGMFE
jgi:hypothetical protein